MKRIGVATIWSDNYGAVLQGYALQKVLERNGYYSEVIRHYRNPQRIANESLFKQAFRWNILSLIEYLLDIKRRRMLHNGFANFKKQYMRIGEKAFYRDSNFEELNDLYDAFICGSDMLWSTMFEEDWPFFYLTFVANNKNTISYAPSFGKNDMNNEQKDKCKNMIKHINYLSCREEAGVNFIKDSFGLNAMHVVDPTLLLSASEWNSLFGNRPRLIKDNYILNYTFRKCNQGGRKNLYEQIEKSQNKSIYFITGQEGKYKHNIYKGYFSPLEFVLLFRDADFVITDTFHGLIFSMIFNKPFIVLDKSQFGESSDRQISTLKTYGLDNRYVKSDSIITDDYYHLDYTQVNEIMNIKRNASLGFLLEAVNNVTKE